MKATPNSAPDSVVGAIFSPDRSAILLVQRRDVPVWTLPGGGVEKGERGEEAIAREIVEETGFRVKVERLVGIYLPVNRLTRLTHLYECIALEGKPTLSFETRDLAFFPLAALPPLMPPPYREWIADALSKEGPPCIKRLTSVTYFELLKNLFRHPWLVLRFFFARLGFPIN